MTFKTFILFVIGSSALAWISWLLILFTVDPFDSHWIAKLFFYLTLFVAISGTLSIASVFYRARKYVNEPQFRHVAMSVRQSLLFTIAIIASLFLMSISLLNIWTSILLVASVSCIELFFITKKNDTRQNINGN